MGTKRLIHFGGEGSSLDEVRAMTADVVLTDLVEGSIIYDRQGVRYSVATVLEDPTEGTFEVFLNSPTKRLIHFSGPTGEGRSLDEVRAMTTNRVRRRLGWKPSDDMSRRRFY